MVASPELHSARFGQRTSKVLLWGLLLIAVALRIWAALTPGFHHPDAIYQYLDPAHRLLTGNGIITWEWRDSIRSWMLPALLAPPLWVGEIVEPDGSLPLILPRIATAAASLGIVWAGWHIGCRHSPLTAALAGFVAATWFELVFFAAETLAEPLAAAAIVPAIALITSPGIKTRYIFLAGMLLGFAALARPHYGIAAASGVLIAWRDDFSVTRFAARKWFVLIGGALLVAGVSAAIDLWQGLTPFVWILENFRQNMVHGVAARYGTLPVLAYVAWILEIWKWWLLPALIGVWFGWRQCPSLLATAAMTFLIHSLVPHKEYRFVFLGFASLTLLSTFGWGEILAEGYRRWGVKRGKQLAVAVFVFWGAASITLSYGPFAPTQTGVRRDGWQTFARLRSDPCVCGVALVEPIHFSMVPGTVGLRSGTPISMFWTDDPALKSKRPGQTAMQMPKTYNRIVTASHGSVPVPYGYRPIHCEHRSKEGMCIFARDGAYTGAKDSPFLINSVLARTGF
jgi:phosphatidylinositol glycan class B